MGGGRLAIDELNSGWYIVHPAFRVRLAEGNDWLGVTERMLGGWSTDVTEEVQDIQLRRFWAAVAHWAVDHGATGVEVDDPEREFAEQLSGLGMRRPLLRAKWFWRGSGSDMSRTLLALREVPRLNMRVRGSRDELVRVRDMSWDSVFVRLGSASGLDRYLAAATP